MSRTVIEEAVKEIARAESLARTERSVGSYTAQVVATVHDYYADKLRALVSALQQQERWRQQCSMDAVDLRLPLQAEGRCIYDADDNGVATAVIRDGETPEDAARRAAALVALVNRSPDTGVRQNENEQEKTLRASSGVADSEDAVPRDTSVASSATVSDYQKSNERRLRAATEKIRVGVVRSKPSAANGDYVAATLTIAEAEVLLFALAGDKRQYELVAAWNANRCGDAECEEARLRAAVAVLGGDDRHTSLSDVVLAEILRRSQREIEPPKVVHNPPGGSDPSAALHDPSVITHEQEKNRASAQEQDHP